MADAIAKHAAAFDRDRATWEETRRDAAQAAGPLGYTFSVEYFITRFLLDRPYGSKPTSRRWRKSSRSHGASNRLLSGRRSAIERSPAGDPRHRRDLAEPQRALDLDDSAQ
jgi:hypothetical protein